MFGGVYECVCMAMSSQRSKSDACEEQIQDEVQRQVKKCVCPKQYHMHKLTDGQYRVCRFQCYFLLLSCCNYCCCCCIIMVIIIVNVVILIQNLRLKRVICRSVVLVIYVVIVVIHYHMF